MDRNFLFKELDEMSGREFILFVLLWVFIWSVVIETVFVAFGLGEL